jgi:hypothetical protein
LASEQESGVAAMQQMLPVAMQMLPVVQGEMSMEHFLREQLIVLPQNKMAQDGLSYFQGIFVEVRDFIYNMHPFVRERAFGEWFDNRESLRMAPQLVRKWLERHVNTSDKLIAKTHDTGKMTRGLMGPNLVCPASSWLINNSFGAIFTTHQLLAATAETLYPEYYATI